MGLADAETIGQVCPGLPLRTMAKVAGCGIVHDGAAGFWEI